MNDENSDETQSNREEGEEMAQKKQSKDTKKNNESGISARGLGDSSGNSEEINGEPDMIARANFAAERLEKATQALKRENDRAEKMHVDQIVSGRGQIIPKVEPKKLSDREYARALMKGDLDNSNN